MITSNLITWWRLFVTRYWNYEILRIFTEFFLFDLHFYEIGEASNNQQKYDFCLPSLTWHILPMFWVQSEQDLNLFKIWLDRIHSTLRRIYTCKHVFNDMHLKKTIQPQKGMHVIYLTRPVFSKIKKKASISLWIINIEKM